MCLAQGHNTVTPVRLEPAALRSRVKHSTTEPLRSLEFFVRTYYMQSVITVLPSVLLTFMSRTSIFKTLNFISDIKSLLYGLNIVH